ncbi:MAG: type II secretion system minor pseudopilin GspI [Pseudohongiellaceae bacterium]
MIAAQRQSGFTLVEVMVALFIVSMALPALMAQVGSQVDGTARLRDRAQAAWVADNALARLTLDARLTGRALQGESSGTEPMAGREWHWRIVAEETAVPGLWRYVASAGLEEGEALSSVEAFRHRSATGAGESRL